MNVKVWILYRGKKEDSTFYNMWGRSEGEVLYNTIIVEEARLVSKVNFRSQWRDVVVYRLSPRLVCHSASSSWHQGTFLCPTKISYSRAFFPSHRVASNSHFGSSIST